MNHHLYILDLGCGKGSSFAELNENYSGQTLIGLDIDRRALLEAKIKHPEVAVVCARAEFLPFANASIDSALSRVSMPYMDIQPTLREVFRILAPSGQVKMKLYPLTYTLSQLAEEIRVGSLSSRLKNLIYRSYVIANGLLLHVFSFTIRYPLARCRCESFQTKSGIRRALRHCGFADIEVNSWIKEIIRPHAGQCWITAKKTSYKLSLARQPTIPPKTRIIVSPWKLSHADSYKHRPGWELLANGAPFARRCAGVRCWGKGVSVIAPGQDGFGVGLLSNSIHSLLPIVTIGVRRDFSARWSHKVRSRN